VLLHKTLHSSTLRLAILCVLLFGAGILGLVGYVYWQAAAYVKGQSDGAIKQEFDMLLRVHESNGASGLARAIDERVAIGSLGGGVYLLVDPAGTYVAGNVKKWPGQLAGGGGTADFRSAALETEAAPSPLLRASYVQLPDGYRLLVGKDIVGYDRFARSIGTALALGVALLFLFAAFAGVSVSRRTVSRIEAVNAMSREIMQANLSRRIPLRGTHDEWDQLASNLNSMLDRIQELVRGIRQVSDGIAHDLRTPLTRIHGRLQGALHRPPALDGYQALVASTIGDIDVVLRTFSALLRISQIESGNRNEAFRPIDLSETAGGVVELFDAAAEEHGGRIEFAGAPGVLVTADRDLLFDALANLVDNAIKYGGAAGHVTVAVAGDGTGPRVIVSDRGKGIPPDARERVLKRFYRLERDRGTPGSGLGLSLVAAVAQLHNAQLVLSDNSPGLRAEIRFGR
jgi:signal transduction histidine kinase